MESRYLQLSLFCILVVATGMTGIIPTVGSVPLLAAYFGTSNRNVAVVEYTSSVSRYLYAVNQSSNNRGSISAYDIDAGHRLIKTIQTVPSVGDVRGVVASAVTGKLYVAYRND